MHAPSTPRIGGALLLSVVVGCVLLPSIATAQGLTGALFGTVKDAQGGVLPGAVARLSSPALIGGATNVTTNEKGQLRFQALPPGDYVLDIAMQGFSSSHEGNLHVEAGATLERMVILELVGLAESVTVESAGARVEARNPGFATHSEASDLARIPTRRSSMFDAIRAAPGLSPTSPSSGTTTTVSAFGSGTNENQFLFDGTNFTCPCNGVARAEPGVDFIQEVQVQSVGASAEYGNVQGAVINVVTKQGGNRFLYDASYYGQTTGLTSQPVLLRSVAVPNAPPSGYGRARYTDATTTLGGPILRNRLWFFAGYQYLRDSDSQPGTDPAFPWTLKQDNIFAKLTWQMAPGWQLVQSLHDELWVNPERPTLVTPFDATGSSHGSIPAVTFGNLTHTSSANTLWDVRVGRFVYSQESAASVGDGTTPSRFDRSTGVTSGDPASFPQLTLARTTVKAIVSHYRPGLWGADHEWKIGGQFETGEHHGFGIIPTGVRFVDNNGQPFQAISSDPANTGGLFITAAAFASDAITIGDRLTINGGVRFDHTRAISQDLPAVDSQGNETDVIVSGLGTLYTWNIVSPRFGITAKLSADGRTLLRASYGRFSQGVFTGELSNFHPGAKPNTTATFDSAAGAYTRIVTVNPQLNLRLDSNVRAPRTDEYSVGVDREIGRGLAVAVAYVHKVGANFIGWTDVGGQDAQDQRALPDGSSTPVFVLTNSTADRRFLLTNPAGYSLTYNGLVLSAEKRRSHGWQASGSYTLSRSVGLLPSSGATAGGPQVSTVAPSTTFGRDPNDLTNASGLLPNDRTHMFRAMVSVDVPRTGLAVAANLQYFTGKPWAATTQISLPQGDQRVQLEPRGTRRLSSQSLLDLRLSRAIPLRGVGRVELILDVLNVLNSSAEEALATDNLFSANFGQPTVFVDPRRAMVSARLNLGR